MRFLVTTIQSTPPPPEMTLGLFDALSGWAQDLTERGNMEQVWSFAGMPGGGGILNVDTLEQLDVIMSSFPLAPFSKIDIYPLVDLEPSLEAVRGAIRAMTPPAG